MEMQNIYYNEILYYMYNIILKYIQLFEIFI